MTACPWATRVLERPKVQAMLRRFMFSGVMMSAVVIPYVMSTGGEWYTAAKNKVASMTASSPKEGSTPNAEGAALAAYGSNNSGQQGHSLAAAHLPRANQVPVEGYG